jgi:hypothetical protein
MQSMRVIQSQLVFQLNGQSYDNEIAVRKKLMLQNQTTARPLLAKLCSS